MSDTGPNYLIRPAMPMGRRFAIGAALFAAGFLLQFLLSWIAGAGFLVAAGILFFAKGDSNKPAASGAEGKWEEVTEVEYTRVVDLAGSSKAWGVSFLDLNSGRGVLTLAALGFGTLLTGLLIGEVGGSPMGAFPWGRAGSNLLLAFLFDMALLVLPLWLSGNETRFWPDDLVIKIRALDAIVRRMQEYPVDGWRLRRLLECRPCGKGAIPGDARLHLVPEGGPEDFLGIQIQVSINNVQGTKYPYLYAVVLAKQGFGLFQAEPPVSKKDVFEHERSDEVDVVVVRQFTSKTSGYHTKAADQVRVFEMALALGQNALNVSEIP